MTMDLITGLAVVASVCMLASALVAAVLPKGSRDGAAYQGAPEIASVASRVLATVVVVFFLTAANLLLIAQQTSLALGTFVVGILLVVVLYLEPSIGGAKRPAAGERPIAEEKEDWRR